MIMMLMLIIIIIITMMMTNIYIGKGVECEGLE